MATKEQHRLRIIEFIADPDNDFPSRTKMAAICNIKIPTLYKHFTPEDLFKIGEDGLKERRKRYQPQLSLADIGLFKRAQDGDPAACKLAYQRFEGWSEKNIQENTFDERTLQALLSVLPPEYLEAIQKKIGA